MKGIAKFLISGCFLAAFAVSGYAGGQREPAPLRVGILPAVDSLPILVARDRGFFEEEGVRVELVEFSNPNERDAAIQARRIDGALLDVLGVAFFVASGSDVRITSLSNGRYGIAASPQSGITNMGGLRGKRIGVFMNTMIQYSVDTLLVAAGVPAEYEAVAVPNIMLRLEMVMNGSIDAAGLPEPLLTAAAAQGARLLATTDDAGIDAGVFTFSKRTLDRRLAEVQAFYRAYDRAAREINADPESFRDFLVEKAGFPEAVRDTFRFVTFSSPQLPAPEQVDRALAWLTERNLLKADLSFDDLTDPRAVAEWSN